MLSPRKVKRAEGAASETLLPSELGDHLHAPKKILLLSQFIFLLGVIYFLVCPFFCAFFDYFFCFWSILAPRPFCVAEIVQTADSKRQVFMRSWPRLGERGGGFSVGVWVYVMIAKMKLD